MRRLGSKLPNGRYAGVKLLEKRHPMIVVVPPRFSFLDMDLGVRANMSPEQTTGNTVLIYHLHANERGN